MGEFIIFLAIAAAGFAAGRVSSPRRAGADSYDKTGAAAFGYGSTLPHPAQIFQEGYEAGHRDAAASGQAARTEVSPAQAVPAQGVPVAPARAPGGPAELLSPEPPRSETPLMQGPPAGLPPRMPAPAGAGAPRPGNPVLSEPASRLSARPVPPGPPPRTAAELAEEKRRRDLRNINITLYSGSLLLVAAAALFIGISIPEQARFGGVAAVAALFYASGLVVHSRRASLRPAALAFTGTGLALIPVVGLALYNLILPDPVLAWLATSLAGTAAFGYAAARLQSRVVTYLALTFLLSTAVASGGSIRSGIVWYFIGTVLLATLISLAAIRKPGWLQNIYLEAFVASHRFLVPATAAAALLTAGELGQGSLAALFLAFAAYYAVLLWQGPGSQDLLHSFGLRAAATAGIVAFTASVTDGWLAPLLAAVVLLGVQAAGLPALRGRYLRAVLRADLPRGAGRADHPNAGAAQRPGQRAARFYLADLLGIVGLQYLAGVAAAAAYALDSQAGAGNAVLFAGLAAVIQLTLCTAAWRLSQRAEFLAPAGVVVPAAACLLTGAAELWPVLANLGILTGYFVLRAASVRRTRAGFVLAARASAAAALPLAVFLLLQDRTPGTAWGWSLAAAFLAAAANQLWSVLAAAAGRQELFPRSVPAVSAGAAVLLAAALRWADLPSTAPFLGALWTVVLLNAVYSALPMRSSRNLAAVYAPAAFLSAGLLGAGLLGVRGYELLCAAALAYCALQSFRPVVPRLRGYYFAAGQVLMTVLAALVAADLGAGAHGVFLVVASVLAAQHAARTVLGTRLERFGPVQIPIWTTLVALAAMPPAYYLLLSTDARAQTGCALLLIAAGCAVLTQVAAALRPAPDGVFPGAPAAAAALAVLLCAGVRASESQASWETQDLTLAVLWAAFAANLFTAALNRNSRLAFMAPAGFLAAALVGAGVLGLRGYELLFAAGLAYCLVLVRDRGSAFRGIYLAGVQGLGAVLAGLLVTDAAGASAGVFFASLGMGLAAGQILRTVLHHRVVGLGSAESVRWGGLAVLALVPVAYLLYGTRTEPAALITTVLSAAAALAVTQLDAALRTHRGRPLPHTAELILAAAAAILLAVPAVRLTGEPYAAWALGILWVGLGANLVTSALLRPGRWETLAAGGFAGSALAGAGLLGVRGYELLVLTALAYALLLSGRSAAFRGQYLLAAQLLAGLLAVLAAVDAGANVHGIIAAGAGVCAAAQLLRTFLEPRPALAWVRAAFWTSAGVLAFTPAVYAGLVAGTVQRDVTALLLVLLLAVSAAEFVRGRHASAGHPGLYPGLYAVGALPLVLSETVRFGTGGVLQQPPLSAVGAGLVLALLGAAALAGEARLSRHAPGQDDLGQDDSGQDNPVLHAVRVGRARQGNPLRAALLGAWAAYSAAVLPVAAAAGENLLLAALAPALLGAGMLSVSLTRRNPWLAAGTPPLLLGAALLAAAGFQRDVLSLPIPPGYGLLWPVWATALVLQAMRMLLSLGENTSLLRLRILGAASSFVLLLGAVPAMSEYNSSAVAGALTLLAALGVALREAPPAIRESAAQAACLPGALALERIAWFVLGGADPFWSVQYWAVVLAGLAAWDYRRRRQGRGTALLAGSAVILSCSGLGTVISGGGGEQLWALVAHAGLLVFGLLASRKLFTSWGAAGMALAVLWYLRGYTFLLLALLAAGLIALAVWRLTRVRAVPEQAVEDALEDAP